MTFDAAFNHVLGAEGGFVDDPRDAGGRTKFGISQRAYPNEDIANLTVDRAKELYHRDYWLAARCDQLFEELALVHFDCAVNQGVRTAALLLQRALGVTADGFIGPVTLAAAKEDTAQLSIIDDYLWLRAERYAQLARDRRSSERFLAGWILRLVRLREATE